MNCPTCSKPLCTRQTLGKSCGKTDELVHLCHGHTDTPIGADEWKAHGEKYGYWDYFMAQQYSLGYQECLRVAREDEKNKPL